jgi:hypothetical protein
MRVRMKHDSELSASLSFSLALFGARLMPGSGR